MDTNPHDSPSSSDTAREEAIFNAARTLPKPERATYLAAACGQDGNLRQRIEVLLESHDQAGDFLQQTVASSAKTLVASPSALEKPGDVIGHYKIRELLGEGGCGAVYVAEQTEPVRRKVALKVIKLGMDTRSVIARFEAERQALALMDHPNIARVLDAGATNTGRPYFVMELVRGIKITDYCDQNNLNTTQRLELFIQVCHAVQHAHQKGIIHRDIKPSNILVTLHDGVPVPKVIDFGIAKATEGRLTDLTIYTELHQFIGTPAYMSPEQAEMSGLDIDTRSDIYSLGVLLYELLTGRTPFDPQELIRSGLDQMRRTIREQEPLRPSTRLSTLMEADLTAVARRHSSEPPKLIHLIRGDLDWIVMKALEKDRTRRFATANALAADAERFLQNEPVEARPPSSAYKLQKMLRRNKTAFAATAAVVAALVFGLGLSLYLYTRERAALKKEKEAVRRALAAERQQALLREEAEKGLAIERRMREMSSLGSKLTSAGFLLSQGLFDKAEEVMKEVPPIVPQAASIYYVLGDQHFKKGELKEAITNFAISVRIDPTNHFGYHYLAPLLILANQRDDYFKLRKEILQHFAQTQDPTVAERMAKDCLILPPPPADLELLGRMADVAVSASSTNRDYPYYQFIKGFAEYRQDHPAAAAGWLQSVIARGDNATRSIEAYAVLAMAQFRQQQLDQARASLVAARELAGDQQGYTGINWNDRIIGQELIAQAAALIDSNSQGSSGSP